MKIIFSNSLLSTITKILFFWPLIYISLIINDRSSLLFAVIMIIALEFLYLFAFNFLFGFIVLKKDSLFVSGGFGCVVQKRLRVQLKEIMAIEFMFEECRSDGKSINFRYTGQPNYLKLYLVNGKEERIYIDRFSFKTWKKLEKYLLDYNSKILVMRDASTFKKYKKTGIDEDLK